MLRCTEPNLPWDLVTNISNVNTIQPPAVSGMWKTLIQKSLRESKKNHTHIEKQTNKHFKTCWPSMKFSSCCSDDVHLFWAECLRTYKQILYLSLKAFWRTFQGYTDRNNFLQVEDRKIWKCFSYRSWIFLPDSSTQFLEELYGLSFFFLLDCNVVKKSRLESSLSR